MEDAFESSTCDVRKRDNRAAARSAVDTVVCGSYLAIESWRGARRGLRSDSVSMSAGRCVCEAVRHSVQQSGRCGALIACRCGTKLSLSKGTVVSCECAGVAQCTRPSCFVSSSSTRAPSKCGTRRNNTPSDELRWRQPRRPEDCRERREHRGRIACRVDGFCSCAARCAVQTQRCDRRADMWDLPERS